MKHVYIDIENMSPRLVIPYILALRDSGISFRVYAYGQSLPIAYKPLSAIPDFLYTMTVHAGKNSADIAISAGIVRDIYTSPKEDDFLLLSNDRDFLPVIIQAKEEGRKIVVAHSSTSTSRFSKELKKMGIPLFKLTLKADGEISPYSLAILLGKESIKSPSYQKRLNAALMGLPKEIHTFFSHQIEDIIFLPFREKDGSVREIPFLDGMGEDMFLLMLDFLGVRFPSIGKDRYLRSFFGIRIRKGRVEKVFPFGMTMQILTEELLFSRSMHPSDDGNQQLQGNNKNQTVFMRTAWKILPQSSRDFLEKNKFTILKDTFSSKLFPFFNGMKVETFRELNVLLGYRKKKLSLDKTISFLDKHLGLLVHRGAIFMPLSSKPNGTCHIVCDASLISWANVKKFITWYSFQGYKIVLRVCGMYDGWCGKHPNPIPISYSTFEVAAYLAYYAIKKDDMLAIFGERNALSFLEECSLEGKSTIFVLTSKPDSSLLSHAFHFSKRRSVPVFDIFDAPPFSRSRFTEQFSACMETFSGSMVLSTEAKEVALHLFREGDVYPVWRGKDVFFLPCKEGMPVTLLKSFLDVLKFPSPSSNFMEWLADIGICCLFDGTVGFSSPSTSSGKKVMEAS